MVLLPPASSAGDLDEMAFSSCLNGKRVVQELASGLGDEKMCLG